MALNKNAYGKNKKKDLGSAKNSVMDLMPIFCSLIGLFDKLLLTIIRLTDIFKKGGTSDDH